GRWPVTSATAGTTGDGEGRRRRKPAVGPGPELGRHQAVAGQRNANFAISPLPAARSPTDRRPPTRESAVAAGHEPRPEPRPAGITWRRAGPAVRTGSGRRCRAG